jgi:predicted transcriptional regulator
MGSYTSGPEYALPDPALERHYSVIEVAKLWGLSENTIRRMFTGEPGVVELGSEGSRFKRAYKTMRIPESVLQRVHRRHAKAG